MTKWESLADRQAERRRDYHAAARRVIEKAGELQGAIADMRAAGRAIPGDVWPAGLGWASRVDGVITVTLQAWRKAEPGLFGPPIVTADMAE